MGVVVLHRLVEVLDRCWRHGGASIQGTKNISLQCGALACWFTAQRFMDLRRSELWVEVGRHRLLWGSLSIVEARAMARR